MGDSSRFFLLGKMKELIPFIPPHRSRDNERAIHAKKQKESCPIYCIQYFGCQGGVEMGERNPSMTVSLIFVSPM